MSGTNFTVERERRIKAAYRILRERDNPAFRQCVERAEALRHNERLDLHAAARIEEAFVAEAVSHLSVEYDDVSGVYR